MLITQLSYASNSPDALLGNHTSCHVHSYSWDTFVIMLLSYWKRTFRIFPTIALDQCVSYVIRTVLLVGPVEDVPPEVRSVTDQLISSQDSCKDVSVLLILHAFQAALGSNQKLQTLRCALQVTHLLTPVLASLVKVKVSFIVNLSVCVYRQRSNTVSHNPEYKNKYV